jgi:hypothetical protein
MASSQSGLNEKASLDVPPKDPPKAKPHTTWSIELVECETASEYAERERVYMSGSSSNPSPLFEKRHSDVSSSGRLDLSESSVRRMSTHIEQKVREQGSSRHHIWELLEEPESSTRAKYFYYFWIGFIVAAVLFSFLQIIIKQNDNAYRLAAVLFETLIDIVFLIELVLRFLVVPSSTFHFISSSHNLLDLTAGLSLAIRTAYLLRPDAFTFVGFF